MKTLPLGSFTKMFSCSTFLAAIIVQILLAPIAAEKAHAQIQNATQLLNFAQTKLKESEKAGYRYYDRNLKPTSFVQLNLARQKSYYVSAPSDRPEVKNLIFSVDNDLSVRNEATLYFSAYNLPDLARDIANHQATKPLAEQSIKLKIDQSKEASLQNQDRFQIAIRTMATNLSTQLSIHNVSKSAKYFASIMNLLLPSSEAADGFIFSLLMHTMMAVGAIIVAYLVVGFLIGTAVDSIFQWLCEPVVAAAVLVGLIVWSYHESDGHLFGSSDLAPIFL